MGLLTLPQGCLAFIDANVVIYSVEKIEPYSTLLLPMWESAKAGDIALIGSELLLLETLVKPLREKDTQLESIYRNLLLASNELRLVSIDASVLDSAARLRATAGLKTPMLFMLPQHCLAAAQSSSPTTQVFVVLQGCR